MLGLEEKALARTYLLLRYQLKNLYLQTPKCYHCLHPISSAAPLICTMVRHLTTHPYLFLPFSRLQFYPHLADCHLCITYPANKQFCPPKHPHSLPSNYSTPACQPSHTTLLHPHTFIHSTITQLTSLTTPTSTHNHPTPPICYPPIQTMATLTPTYYSTNLSYPNLNPPYIPHLSTPTPKPIHPKYKPNP